jgi:hypothetical protein
MVSENKVLRRILGPKREEIIGNGKHCIMKKFHNLYSSPNVI